MKTFVRFLIVASVSFFNPSSHAFELVTVGVHGGASFSSTSTDPSTSASTRTGIVVGVNAEMEFLPSFYLQPEINYMQRGSRQVSATGADVINRYDYLEMPLLGKFKQDFWDVRFLAAIGPSLAFAVRRTQDTTAGSLASNTRAFDLGIHGLVGVEYALNAEASVYFQGRYLLGLIDIDESSATTTKNRNLLVVAGMAFNF